MNINELEGKELAEAVATKVMKWTALREPGKAHLWVESGHFVSSWRPDRDIATAWTIHQTACKWVFSKRKAYLKYLQDAVSQRVMPLDYIDLRSKVSWPDVLVFLEPEDFCRAALMAAEAE